MNKRKHRLSDWQTVLLGYLILILFGSLLLFLPISSKSGYTPYVDALFTSTSATCVTGLIVYDTFTHWTLFGQIVILFLIQVGGIGIMTIISLFAIALRGKPGLYQNVVIMHASGSSKLSEGLNLVKRIVLGTVVFEFAGAILLSIRFCAQFGFWRGLWLAVFHSVSAFCNAGFDLMGINESFSSFTAYSADPLVSLTLCMLIFMGGLGFMVWNDLFVRRFRFRKLQTHTQTVIVASAFFVLLPAMLFLIFERHNLFANTPFGESLLASIFASISPRTAGFNTVDMSAMSESGIALTIFLMFIGGNPASTAGGIKVTTFIIILFGVYAAFKNSSEVQIGKKRMPIYLLIQAIAILATYLFAVTVATIIILAIEPYSLSKVVFEVVSALGTVGLTLGITSGLTVISKLILMLLMYMGKVGVITLLYSLASHKKNPDIKRPMDTIQIG